MSPEITTERSLGDTKKPALSSREGSEFVQNPPHPLEKIPIGSNRFVIRLIFGGLLAAAVVGGFASIKASADSPTVEETRTPTPSTSTNSPKYQVFLPFLARKVDQHGQPPCDMPPVDPNKPLQAQGIAANMCRD